MKIYEYLAALFEHNQIDLDEVETISMIYLHVSDRYDQQTWVIRHNRLNATRECPINPMHIEEWDDDLKQVWHKGNEYAMQIQVKTQTGDILTTIKCFHDPRKVDLFSLD